MMRSLLLRGIPLGVQRRLTPRAPVIVFFHGLGQEQVYIRHLYRSRSAAEFEELLDQLLKRFTPLQDLSAEHLARADSRHFVITFDDGLRSTREIAVPILERKGLPAIFFINPDFISGKSDFYRFQASLLCHTLKKSGPEVYPLVREILRGAGCADQGNLQVALKAVEYSRRQVYREIARALDLDMDAFFRDARPFMTTDDARDLQGRGFYLGAHSCDHPRYCEIPLDEQIRQTRLSMEWVQETFELSYRYFAFPFHNRGVGTPFYQATAGDVDLYFTTHGWWLPERNRSVYHRVGLDSATSAVREIRSRWRPPRA
ncbi:polysaccharide deacetylase family protein [Alkalispirochaeta sphaeroplastigenens]|nr:polysaccharide deacetylase family protein [Alkalispirochaeta sphaeroplastigenens]